MSNENLIDQLNEINEFEMEQLIFKSETQESITIFDPYIWIAERIDYMIADKYKIKLLFNTNTYPVGIIFDNLSISQDGDINTNHLINICKLAFYDRKNDKKITTRYFDPLYYYYIHHEQIDHYFSYREMKISNGHKACIFYVCYGIFLQQYLEPIYSLLYVASYPQLIETIQTDETSAQKLFYNTGNKIIFDPYMYVASNYEKSHIKEFIKCNGDIDEKRAIKHYIRTGFTLKYSHDSFKYWNYLANNHKRIDKILKQKSKKNFYDVIALTKRTIAKDFIKKNGKQKLNKFNEVDFVKQYVNDKEYVNNNGKLCIENAAEYFVKYYVISKRVRFECGLLYTVLQFFRNRAIDSAKQIPYNAVKYIVQTKFL